MPGGNYGIDSAIREVGDNIAQNVARYQALPPLRKGRVRAGLGAGLLAFGVYTAAGRPAIAFGGLIAFGVWAAVVAFGGLWFYIGVTSTRSPRDVMSAVWSAIALAIFAVLAAGGASLTDGGDFGLFGDFRFFIEGVFLAGVIGSLVRLWLAVRGMPSTGLGEVRAQEAHGSARDATLAEAAAKLGGGAPRPQRQFQD
jgi:hypothetical protein